MIIEQAVRDSRAAYQSSTVDINGTQYLVIDRPDSLTVAFRGTETDEYEDLLTDLRFWPVKWDHFGAQVHGGFKRALEHVYRPLCSLIHINQQQYNDKPLVFTGHSLGGALATLAHSLWPDSECITFGAPRVGNKEFWETCFDIERYRRDYDIVPLLPLTGRVFGLKQGGSYYYNGRLEDWTLWHRLATFRGQIIGWKDHSIYKYVEDCGGQGRSERA